MRREWRIWTRGRARRKKPCRFGGGVLRMWNVSFAWGAAEWGMCHAAQEYFSRRCHRSTQKPCRVLLSKNTDCTDAHGWVFSRILYSCSAAYRLVYRCAVGATDCHGFFRRRRVVWENVTRWACLVCEKSVEIREICGRQLSAQCAKEQAGCFILPRISQISTDAMRTACQ